MRTIRGSFEQLIDPAWHTNKNFGDYVFAELTDTGELYPMEKLRTLFPRLLGLRALYSQGEGQQPLEVGAARQRLGPLEQFALFYQAMAGEELSSEQLEVLKQACADNPQEVAP